MLRKCFDTTQDNNVVDQCAVIVRYIKDNEVYERLIGVINCVSGKCKYIHDIVRSCLDELNIEIKYCIGNSTDGAANMQGQYNGFTTWLSKGSPKQILVWCYAHVLNLVIGEVTKLTFPVISLFGLINKVAVFMQESYLRMHVSKSTSSMVG
jgi:hypothetical protein